MQDEIINNLYLTLKENQLVRLYDHLFENTFKKLLESVTPQNRKDIETIISDMKKKEDKHEELIKNLRSDHYNSA